MFDSYPGRGFGGFSYSTGLSSFFGAFLLSFLPPFLAFSASSSFRLRSSSFFFSIQSNSVLVTNRLIVIESSQSLYSSPACLTWTDSQRMGKSLCDTALSDLKMMVMALLDLLEMCPTRGTKVKSSWAAHWNLIVSFALFLIEKLSLFYYLIMQSPKEILSSSSDGKFSKRIS